MLIKEYVKRIFEEPDMPDDAVEIILWGCTGFPCFWIGDPIRCFTKQLRHAKRALKRGFSIEQIFEGSDTLTAKRG